MTNNTEAQSLTPEEVRHFIQEMPKAEIHIHLEGAIQPEVVLELAQRHGIEDRLPGTDVATLREWFRFTDFPHFVQIYVTISDLLRTPDDFATIAYECGRDMAAQNIRYREATFTPYTHTNILDKGLTITDILSGLSEGRARAKEEWGVDINWIFDIPRNFAFKEAGEYTGTYNPEVADKTLEFALAGQGQGVVGFGLGGYEVGAPPEPFAHAFEEAGKAGLRLVPHAGETMGADSVWGAVKALGAERIGHGVRAMEDPNLLHYLKEHQVTLEVSPTSNICLHVYRRHAEHPFPHLDRMGLNLTINSDDPPLFNTTLCQEYEMLASEFGYQEPDLIRIARNAFMAATVTDTQRMSMLSTFDAWAETKRSPA